jgi:septum formation protein
MLAQLSGRTHHVMTAVAVSSGEEVVAEIATSAVSFRALARDEIARYVATGESVDKAGAYAIQGRAAAFVMRLEGSYTGVMGLPLYETASLLARIGVHVL